MKVTDSSKRLSFDVYNINEIQPKYPVCFTFLCIITDIVEYAQYTYISGKYIYLCSHLETRKKTPTRALVSSCSYICQ